MQVKERDHETFLFYRAMKESNAARDDLLIKEMLISDHQRRIYLINKELKDFIQACAVSVIQFIWDIIFLLLMFVCLFVCLCMYVQVVKAEKSKQDSQLFYIRQVHTELTEKNKILANEKKIFLSSSMEKSKYALSLHKHTFNHMVIKNDNFVHFFKSSAELLCDAC